MNRELCNQFKQGDVDSVGQIPHTGLFSLEKGECAEPSGLEPRRGIPRETQPGELKWTFALKSGNSTVTKVQR